MIPRLRALALACAMVIIHPGPSRAQAVAPDCRPFDDRARSQKTWNEQLVGEYSVAMRTVRAAKEAGDYATAIRYLRQSRRIGAAFGPLIQETQANAVAAHRRGCIDDDTLAKALEGTRMAAQTYRSLDTLSAAHERELRPYLARR